MAEDEGAECRVEKSAALVAFKRAAPFLPVSAIDILLIDTLTAFSQDQDWYEGSRPVVWASNSLLCERSGLQVRTLRNHFRKLSELGLIAFKDSSNGKRFGKRSDEGAITEAYGFDLSPLAIRAEELQDLYHHMSQERQLVRRLRREITIARRSIRMMIETAQDHCLSGTWRDYLNSLEDLIASLSANHALEDLAGLKDRFTALQEQVRQAYEVGLEGYKRSQQEDCEEPYCDEAQKEPYCAIEEENISPREESTDPHILTTRQPYLYIVML